MIRPYNKLWMDCVTNNLIAMLACQNEDFLNFPCYMDTIYLKKVLNQSYSSEGDQENMMSSGLYFPKIQYSLGMLNNYIDKVDMKIDISEQAIYEDIHNIIKRKIDDNYCVFILVDRFFYPTGVDSNVAHMVHPTFIYGYDDETESYLAFEDCIIVGEIDYYRIPYKSLNMSSEYILSEGKTINIEFCRANEAAKKFNGEIQIAEVVNSLERMLLGGQVYNKDYNLYYHSGLDSLSSLIDEISILYNNLKDENIYRTRLLSFCQYHKRNQDLVSLISKYRNVNIDEIQSSYGKLCEKWTIYKNKSNYLLEKRRISGRDVREKELEGLKIILDEIINLEKSTINNMLHLTRALV